MTELKFLKTLIHSRGQNDPKVYALKTWNVQYPKTGKPKNSELARSHE